MVGRGRELDEIIRLLALPECRLLTISGLGGIGKTRLALQVALDLTAAAPSQFADGVCFVPLAAVRAPENIPKAIARATGFDFSGSPSPEDQLLSYLQSQRVLLVLDNAEHLLAGVDILTRMLEQAPGVKLLVTSRERLNLRAEWVFDLHGLPVPPVEAGPDLEDYSAAKLFLARARQVKNGFCLHEAERPVIAHICRLLDGIPLGLELAAAWVRFLSLDEIAAEIARDLGFLSTTARDVPERQRSLRVVFDHSWSLLPPGEQSALRQLSVFQGGFTREAAEAVAGISPPVLTTLIDKSLVRHNRPARYDLHELVRGYAAAWLAREPDEGGAAQARHSHYYLTLVRDSGPDLHSAHQRAALARLSPELANIRAAWTRALDQDQIESLNETAQSLWYLFELLNYYREGEVLFAHSADVVTQRLTDASASEGAGHRDAGAAARGRFLMHQAYFAMRLGQVDRAEACCQSSIAALRSVRDPGALAHALAYYAVLNWTTGHLGLARTLLEESLPLSTAHGHPWQIALTTAILGNVAYERGEYCVSQRLLREALERAEVVGDPRLIGYVSAYVGRTALRLGWEAETEAILQAGAQLTQAAGDRFCHALNLEQLALAAQARGDLSEAERLLQASIDGFRETGDAWSLSRALASCGTLMYVLGDLPQAVEHLKSAIRLSLKAHALLTALSALAGLARVYHTQGRTEAALQIVQFVVDHPAATADAEANARDLYTELTAELSPEQVAASERRVRGATPEELIRLCL
jgi:predicted ATPase